VSTHPVVLPATVVDHVKSMVSIPSN